MFAAFVALFFVYWCLKILGGGKNLLEGILVLSGSLGFLGMAASGIMFLGTKVEHTSARGYAILYNTASTSAILLSFPIVVFAITLIWDAYKERRKPKVEEPAKPQGFMPKGYSANSSRDGA